MSFGIDFGTTNTAAVQLGGSQPFLYGDDAGNPLPSIIAIDKATGKAVGGRKVWEQRDSYISSENYHVVQSVKRLLATDVSWYTEARTWYPEDVAAEVFKQLSNRTIERGVTGGLRKAMITIPVDFSVEQRRSLRRAAEKARIEVSGFVNEPTAAIMRYVDELRHCRYLSVFDWGGGTLDVSVVEIRGGRVFELATNVMKEAGDDLDLDFAAAVHRHEMDRRGESLPFESAPPKDRDGLRTQCERAKCRLTANGSESVTLPSYCGSPLTIRVDRDWFENVIRPRVARGIALLASTIQQAGLPFEVINRLIVTGGSSKLRLVHEELLTDSRFSSAYFPATDPGWDVAHGAALINLSPGEDEIAEEIGLLLSDGSFFELVRAGDKAGAQWHELTVALVEESSDAHIVLARRRGGSPDPERILMLSAPTNGFDAEGIKLEYHLTKDLSFSIRAHSHALGPSTEVKAEYGKLRFGYKLPN